MRIKNWAKPKGSSSRMGVYTSYGLDDLLSNSSQRSFSPFDNRDEGAYSIPGTGWNRSVRGLANPIDRFFNQNFNAGAPTSGAAFSNTPFGNMGLPIPGRTSLVSPNLNNDAMPDARQGFMAHNFGAARREDRQQPDGSFNHYDITPYGNDFWVNNINRPAGAFQVTRGLDMQGNFISAQTRLNQALESPNLIPALQAGASPYMRWQQMTPQNLAKASTLTALPRSDMFTNEIGDMLSRVRQNTGQSDWVHYGGQHIFRAGPVADQTFMRNAAGDYIGTRAGAVKGFQLGGIHETGMFEHAPGVPGRIFNSPFRTERQSAPMQGTVTNALYLQHNLWGEGQKMVESDFGVVTNFQKMVVPVPEGGFQFQSGDVFSLNRRDPRMISAGDRYMGQVDQIPGLPNISGSYAMGRVADMKSVSGYDMPHMEITLGLSTYVAGGSASKVGEKFSNAPVEPGYINSLVSGSQAKVVSALPSAKDFGAWSQKVWRGQYAGDVAGSTEALIQGAVSQGIDRATAAGWYEGGVIRDAGGQYALNTMMQHAQSMIENAPVVTISNFRLSQSKYDSLQGAMVGDQPVIANAVQQNDGTYLADIRTKAIETPILDRFRMENAQEKMLFSEEMLNAMALTNRGAYDQIRARVDSGELFNPAEDLMRAYRANTNAQVRGQLSPLDADKMDIARMQRQAIESGPGLTPEQLGEQTLRQIQKTYGDSPISIAGTIFPSARTAASGITYDEEGAPINNFNTDMVKALEANERVRQLRESGVDTSDAAALRGEAVSKAQASMSELANTGSIIKRSRGVEMAAASGIATHVEGVADNEGVIRSEDLFRLTNARTARQKRQVLQKAERGEVPLLYTMFPHPDPTKALAVLKASSLESVQRRAGMAGASVPEGGVGVGDAITARAEKDKDSDQFKAVAGAGFVNGRWVNKTGAAMSAEQVRRQAESGYSKEMGGIREKAQMSLGGYFKKAWEAAAPVSLQKLVSEYDERAVSKGWMGPLYNQYVRSQFSFGAQVGSMAGLNEGQMSTLTASLGNIAKRNYQPALDMENIEPTIKTAFQIASTGNYDWRKGAMTSAAGYVGDDGPVEFAGGNNPENVAREIFKAYVNQGRGGEGWETNTLPDLVNAAMPNRLIGNAEATAQMTDVLRNFKGKESEYEKILGITGLGGINEGVFGRANDPDTAKNLMVGPAAVGASFVTNALKKNEAYKDRKSQNLIPGAGVQLSRLYNQIRGFDDVRKGQSVEDVIAGAQLRAEASAVSTHTAYVQQRLGGVTPIAAPDTEQVAAAQEVAANRRSMEGISDGAIRRYSGLLDRQAETLMANNEWSYKDNGEVAFKDRGAQQAFEMLSKRQDRVFKRLNPQFNNAPPSGSGAGGQAPPPPPPGQPGAAASAEAPEPGAPGGVNVGNTRIDAQTVNNYTNQIRVPYMGSGTVADAAETVKLLKEFGGRLREINDVNERLVKSGGELSESQKQQRDVLVKTYEHLDKMVGDYRTRQKLSDVPETIDDKRFGSMINQPEVANMMATMGSQVGRARRSQRYESFNESMQPMDEDERQSRLMEVLLRGGRGGARARAAASNQHLYDGGLDGIPFKSQGALNMLGGAARLANRARGAMWSLSHIQYQVLNPMQRQAEEYQTMEAERGMGMASAGLISYGDLMGGQYGDITRRQASSERVQQEANRQVYMSYGGLMSGAGGEARGRTQGMIQSVASPTMGMAALGGTFGPIGAAIMGGLTLAGTTANYAYQASNDVQTLASNRYIQMQNERRHGDMSGLGARFVGSMETFFSDIGGSVGTLLASGDNRDRADRLAIARTELSDYAAGNPSALFKSLGSDKEILSAQQRLYGLSNAESQSMYADVFRENAATKYGIGEQQANSLLGFQRMYMPNTSVYSPAMTDLKKWTSLGMVDIPNTALAGAAAMGRSTLDRGAVEGQSLQINDYLNKREGWYGAGAMPLVSASIAPAMQQAGAINEMRRKSGRAQVGWESFGYEDPYKLDIVRQNIRTQAMTQNDREMLQNPLYAQAMQPFEQLLVDSRVAAGDPATATRYERQSDQMSGMVNNLLPYNQNASRSQIARLGMFANTATQQQFSLFNAMAGGDRLALSQNWRKLIGTSFAPTAQDAIGFQTIDPTTGLGAYEQNVNSLEAGFLRSQDTYGWISPNVNLSGGTRGIQAEQRDRQKWMNQYQFNAQTLQRNMGFAMMTGGSTPNEWGMGNTMLDMQGRAFGGDGLQQLASVFRSAGMPFNKGNGMGQWQVQDAMQDINRAQQLYGMTQSARQIDLQTQEFDQSGRQFLEKWNLSNREFEYNTAYSRSQMSRQRSHQITQTEWQSEDMAFDRSKSEIQFGWQLQDADRNLRYARGRERLDMIRQRDRAVLMHSMDQGQRDKQETRFETQKQWETEEYELKKEHFEQGVKFQRESLDMQKRHFEEDRGLQQKRMDMVRENHDKEMAWTREYWALQDQQRILERQSQLIQFQMETEMAEKTKTHQEKMTELSNTMQGMSDVMEIVNGRISIFTTEMSKIIELAQAVTAPTAAPEVAPATGASGGTGGGGGSSGGGSTALDRIADLISQLVNMGPGRVNATIYTNDQQVNTQDIFNAAHTRTRR